MSGSQSDLEAPPTDAEGPPPEPEPTPAAGSLLARTFRFVQGRLAGEGLGRTLARGAIWSIGINGLGAALSFIVQWVLARTLGVEAFGIYVYVLATMNLAAMCRFEMDTASVRFVGQYFGSKDWALLRGFLRRSNQVVWTSVLVVGAAGGLLAWSLQDRLDPGLGVAYAAVAVLLVPSTLLRLSAGVLQGFKRVPESQAPTLLVRPFLFGLAVTVLVFGAGVELSAPQAILLNTGASSIALIVSRVFEHKARPDGFDRVKPAFDTRLWASTAGGLTLLGATNLLLSHQMAVLFVGTGLSTTDAGLYGLSAQLVSLMGLGATAVVYVALPYISDLHARGETAELQRVVSLTGAATMAIGIGGFLVLVPMGRTILGIFGEDFRAAYPVLVTQVISSLTIVTYGIMSGYLMTMTGHHNKAWIVTGIAAGITLSLFAVLIPRFGAVGAAAAVGISALFRGSVLAWLSWKYVGVNLLSFRAILRPRSASP